MIACYILFLTTLFPYNMYSKLEGLCIEQDTWWRLKNDTQKSVNEVYLQVLGTVDSASWTGNDEENQ